MEKEVLLYSSCWLRDLIALWMRLLVDWRDERWRSKSGGGKAGVGESHEAEEQRLMGIKRRTRLKSIV